MGILRRLGPALLVLILIPLPSRAATPQKPNIILIYSDDLGYGDVGCYGATKVFTPHIDELAAAGLRFLDAHTTASTCTPSRYSILTGRYAFRNPLAQVLPGDAPILIKPGTPTLPSLLKQAGYATACIGKWHVGLGQGSIDWNGDITPGPLELGFDYAYYFAATPDRVPCVYIQNHRIVNLDPADPIAISYQHKIGNEPTGKDHPELLRYPPNGGTAGHAGTIVDRISRIGWMTGGKAAWWKDEEMSNTLTSQAENFMVQHKDQPFFIYFAINGIHVPHAPNQQFLGTSQCGLRGDSIEELDADVGRIQSALINLKLQDNTLIILSSDNGPILDDGYADGSIKDAHGHHPAGPLRGGKYSIYEGGTRVPFLTVWPGRIKPAQSGALVSQVDLAASLAWLAGVALPPDAAPDSLNVLPALLGDAATGRDHLIEQSAKLLALRSGEWKFIPAGRRQPNKRLEEGDTSDAPPLSPAGQLFDLSTDLSETKNVAAEHSDLVAQFSAELQREEQQEQTRTP